VRKINAAQSVPLPNTKSFSVHIRNEGDHTDNIGVYADIIPPGGMTNPFGCTPIGRVISTGVMLAPGTDITVSSGPLFFDCANRAGAAGQSYTIVAAADAHADDAAACPVFQIQSMTCFNALADDDNDSSDNRLTTNAFQVK